jgi:hypothetical protein
MKLNENYNKQTVLIDEVSRSVRSIPATLGRYGVKILTWTFGIMTKIFHSFLSCCNQLQNSTSATRYDKRNFNPIMNA